MSALRGAALVAALALLAACGGEQAPVAAPAPPVTVAPPAPDIADGKSSTWRQVDDLFAKTTAYAPMRKYYPDYYSRMIDKISDRVAANPGMTEKEAFDLSRAAALDAVNDLIRDHGADAAGAPPETVKTWLAAHLAYMRGVQTESGDALCGALATKGSAALPPDYQGASDLKLKDIDAEFTAMGEGAQHPVARTPMTKQDTEAYIAWMDQATKSDEAARADLAGLGGSDAESCKATLRMMQLALEMPGDVADRVRGDMLNGTVIIPK